MRSSLLALCSVWIIIYARILPPFTNAILTDIPKSETAREPTSTFINTATEIAGLREDLSSLERLTSGPSTESVERLRDDLGKQQRGDVSTRPNNSEKMKRKEEEERLNDNEDKNKIEVDERQSAEEKKRLQAAKERDQIEEGKRLEREKRLRAAEEKRKEAEQERIRGEEKRREEEQERLRAEEKMRKEVEQERLRAEEKMRKEEEQERLCAEEKMRKDFEQERLRAEEERRKEKEQERLRAEEERRERRKQKRIRDEERIKERQEKLDYYVMHTPYISTPDQLCGRRTTRSGRIVGGDDTFPGEFPWAVSVRIVTVHHCGGTIINKYWVLTAAHCVKRFAARYYNVRPGIFNIHEINYLPMWDIKVKEIVLHPDFGKPRRYSNDVALLKLKKAVSFNLLTQPICLPPPRGEDFDGWNATVVGWGWLNEDEKERPILMQKVIVPVLNNTICARWFSEDYNRYFEIDDYQICAGYKEGGKDACEGDSGGPLVTKGRDNQFTIIGVVSAGVGCARKNLPGLYSRVSFFVPWILQVTGDLNAP